MQSAPVGGQIQRMIGRQSLRLIFFNNELLVRRKKEIGQFISGLALTQHNGDAFGVNYA